MPESASPAAAPFLARTTNSADSGNETDLALARAAAVADVTVVEVVGAPFPTVIG
jgi:hypothetical protein